jgi:hypothetical protein
MNKNLAYLLAGSLPFAMPLCACAAALQLNLPVVTQQHSEWCWDADASAILQYRGIQQSQCAIANWVYGISYACGNYPFNWNNSANSPNAMTGSTGISGIVWNLGGRHWYYYSQAVSYSTASNAINHGNPVVILWEWQGGGGHFVVLDGYDDNGHMLYFMNPWPGEGAGYGSYTWIAYGTGDMGTHAWAESLITY